MSFYPPDQGPSEAPYDPYDPNRISDRPAGAGYSRQAGLERAKPPGIAMIVVGALNLLLAMGAFGLSLVYSSVPPAEFERMMQQQHPELIRDLKAQGKTVQDILNIIIYLCVGGGISGIVTGIIGIVGGILMLRGAGYGFAVFSAIVIAVPVVSCCCIGGQAVGIWALVILFQDEVKAAFH
jgi:hypothetical protein